MSQLTLQSPRRAFTLLELLVCLAIICLLLTILMPSIAAVKNASRTATCANNLRMLGLATLAYSLNNDEGLPTCSRTGVRSDNWAFWQPGRDIRQSALAPFLPADRDRLYDVFRCPAQPIENQQGFRGGPVYTLTYSMNGAVGVYYPLHLNQIHNPSGKILMYDENENADDDIFWYLTARDTLAGRHASKSFQSTNINNNGATKTNRGYGGVLYVDGHVGLADNDMCHIASINDLSMP